MVFKNCGTLELAERVWRVSSLAARRCSCCGVVWEPVSSCLGASSSYLRADPTGSGSGPRVTRQWDTQTAVGTPTPVSGGDLRRCTVLSVLVATRESWRGEKFLFWACGHRVCARGRGVCGHATSPPTRPGRGTVLW